MREDNGAIRAAIITQQAAVGVPLLLEELLKRRADSIVTVFIADHPQARGPLATLRRWTGRLDPLSFLCYGVSHVAVKLSVTGPRRVARRYAVEVERVREINAAEFHERLRKLQIDLLISAACPQIFGAELLALPPLGCLNVHSGPLPRYRGMLPTFWALYRGEQATAVTVHVMNERLDDGPIVLQETVAIREGETQAHLMRRCKSAGGRLLARTIDLLELDAVELRENPREEATYYSFPTPRQARDFRRGGGRWR